LCGVEGQIPARGHSGAAGRLRGTAGAQAGVAIMSKAMIPLRIAVLTVSDTRDFNSDRSGALLAERLTEAGHQLAERRIVIDDVYRIRAVVSEWIASPEVQVI